MPPSSSRRPLYSPGPRHGDWRDHASAIEVMFRSLPPDFYTNPEWSSHEIPPKYPVYYFFYGPLRAPATLKRVLDLPEEEEPELRPAQIIGYALCKRPDRPALVNGVPGQVVNGSAYLVKSEEQARKLADYAAGAYQKEFPCGIQLMDDKSLDVKSGTTFVHAGDQRALLEQWKLLASLGLRYK